MQSSNTILNKRSSLPIEFVGASPASFPADQGNEDGTDLTIPVPSGVQSGDILLVIERWAGVVVPTAPSGWSELFNITGSVSVFNRTANSSEPADYTWTGVTDLGRAGCMVAFRNCTIGDTNSSTLPSSNPMVIPTVTALADGAALVALSGKPISSFSNTYTANSPLIEAAQHEAAQGDGGNPSAAFIAYELSISAGSISGREIENTATFSASAAGICLEPL